MSQKKRATKTSKGVHGGGGRHRGLSGVEKVLLGKGAFASFKPVGTDPLTQGPSRAAGR